MNKITYYTLFVFTFLTTCLSAQTQEVKQQMSLGIQNGISVNIPDADAKFIDKIWKKYTKDYGKLSKNKKAESIGYVPKFTSLQGIEYEIDKLLTIRK